jgi:DNA invertase Pin-like site-specific DNA recombinase
LADAVPGEKGPLDKTPRRIGYARVSTEEQSLNLQLDALRAAGCTRIFKEKISGRVRRGPELKRAMAILNPGDSIVVWRTCRLGRTFRHRVDLGDELQDRGVTLVSLTEGLDTSTSFGVAIYRVLSIFADMEHDSIVMRTRAGLASARARGVRLGKPPKLTPQDVIAARNLLASGMKAEAVAATHGVTRSTIYRHLALSDRPAYSGTNVRGSDAMSIKHDPDPA